MTEGRIIDFLQYWDKAEMVAIDQIRAFDQVYTARKFCACMRQGVFSDVTDLQIWRALERMRAFA